MVRLRPRSQNGPTQGIRREKGTKRDKKMRDGEDSDQTKEPIA